MKNQDNFENQNQTNNQNQCKHKGDAQQDCCKKKCRKKNKDAVKDQDHEM